RGETGGPADRQTTRAWPALPALLAPPRREAVEAVKECHAGGIRMTMITGDHKITAAAIAKMLEIGDGTTAIAGAEVEEMDTATPPERGRARDGVPPAHPHHQVPA